MHLERPCEYYGLLMIAKTVNQKYHNACSNKVTKARGEERLIKNKEKRRLLKYKKK